MPTDILIRNADLADGTGDPLRRADIAVQNGRIAAISGPGEQDPANAAEVIEAEGLLVTPGFIDPHTHYDGQATWDDHLSPSADHGVSTVVMGNCGVGFAPVRPGHKKVLIDLMEGVEDIPGAALHDGIRWAWESFPEYLDALETLPRSIDVAAQLPHGALRTYAIGEGGNVNGPATDEQVAMMARLAREAVEAGAVAFSSNRIALHTSTSGEAVPGTFAESREVSAIMQAAKKDGHALLQVVPAGLMGEDPDGFRREIAFYRALSLETGCTVLFTIAQNNVQPELWRELFELADAANAAGAKLVPMTINRPGGLMLSWDTFHPFSDRKSYVEIADLPLSERVAALRDRSLRARILAEPIETPMFEHANLIIMSSLGSTFLPTTTSLAEPDPNASLAARMEASGLSEDEVVYDALCDAAEAEGGPGFLNVFMGNYADGNLDVVHEMITRPGTLVGGGDGGAHVTVICDASYPTYMLQHWVRERVRGERLPVETAVRMLTRDPAELYGMNDRGIVARGRRADLNVIDLGRVALGTPRIEHDLPTGAPRLLQGATGYVATLVAGEVTNRDGKDTGARPGRVVRG
ncbi:MAG: amidohydrolase family protein [Deltaproteobacteria bacterium]|jgi:N-acyl-D-aspartate/D-glutamate deacylase|nr:amidohydrolase family protein [Deltaproteobacteria bacterium]